MSDNPQGTGAISFTDAVSLLNTPPADTVTEEQVEALEPQQPETEAYEPEEDTAEATSEDDYAEDDEGEDAYEADDGEEYEEATLADDSKYFIAQIRDLQAKRAQLQF